MKRKIGQFMERHPATAERSPLFRMIVLVTFLAAFVLALIKLSSL